MDAQSQSLIVVVDGGGSTCRVNVCDPSGKVLGHARGKSANIATDFDGALANIVDACKLAYGAGKSKIGNILAHAQG